MFSKCQINKKNENRQQINWTSSVTLGRAEREAQGIIKQTFCYYHQWDKYKELLPTNHEVPL